MLSENVIQVHKLLFLKDLQFSQLRCFPSKLFVKLRHFRFVSLCHQIQCLQYQALVPSSAALSCCEVCWLSWGDIMSRVVSQKDEITKFFDRVGKEQSCKFVKKSLRQRWFLKLACLNNIVFHLNALNMSLQGRFTMVIDFVDNIQAFIMEQELVGLQNQRRTLQHV